MDKEKRSGREVSTKKLTFTEWLKERKEKVKEETIRLDAYQKTDEINKWFYSWLQAIYIELFSIYDALEWFYNESEKHRPMLDFLASWVEEKKKEEEEKKKYR